MSVRHTIKGLLSSPARLRRDQRGSVPVLFTVAAIPTLGLIGAAIDYSRGTGMVAQAPVAAYAAVLAAGAHAGGTEAHRPTVASNIATPDFVPLADTPNLTVTETPGSAGLAPFNTRI